MIVMHHAKPNKLQCQALLIADKVSLVAIVHAYSITATTSLSMYIGILSEIIVWKLKSLYHEAS